MVNSILDSIKQMLGINSNDTAFDQELIMHINSAISILTQLGIGPEEGFRISGSTETFDSLTEGQIDIEDVRSQIYFRCRLWFDLPQNSFLVKNFEDQVKEIEWRLEVATDPYHG